MVHDLVQASAALTAAAEAGVGVVLESPPDAVHSLGIGYFLAMIAAARAAAPEARCVALLDCGRAPGLALAALRAGAEAVRLDAPREVVARVSDIAGQRGARVETESFGRSIDLAAARDPLATAREALQPRQIMLA